MLYPAELEPMPDSGSFVRYEGFSVGSGNVVDDQQGAEGVEGHAYRSPCRRIGSCCRRNLRLCVGEHEQRNTTGREGKHTARTRDASSCPSCLPQESRESPSGRLEGLDLRRVACQSIIKGRGMKKTYRVKSSCLLSW